MVIKLTDILSVPGKIENLSLDLDLKEMKLQGYDCEVSNQTPLQLTLTNLGNQRLHMEGNITLDLNVPCDRCLTPVAHHLEIAFDQSLDVTDDDDNQDLWDVSYINEYQLDIDMLIYEEVSVRLPMKNLCSDDCKGICSVCGCNLNLKECGCNRKVADPRMADVLDIFNQFFDKSDE